MLASVYICTHVYMVYIWNNNIVSNVFRMTTKSVNASHRTPVVPLLPLLHSSRPLPPSALWRHYAENYLRLGAEQDFRALSHLMQSNGRLIQALPSVLVNSFSVLSSSFQNLLLILFPFFSRLALFLSFLLVSSSFLSLSVCSFRSLCLHLRWTKDHHFGSV